MSYTPKPTIILAREQQEDLEGYCKIVKDMYNSLSDQSDFVPNGKFTLVMPSSFISERRKSLPLGFQDWADNTIMIPMLEIIFGKSKIEYVKEHLSAFKIRTEPVSEFADHYRKPIYHWHVDAKIGILQENNLQQTRITRVLVNIGGGDQGSTVYLKDQPRGFPKQTMVSKYLNERFEEVGLKGGKLRELFKTDDKDIFRAKAGEVFVHESHSVHGGYPIHAEANPSPKGRTLLAIDLINVKDLF